MNPPFLFFSYIAFTRGIFYAIFVFIKEFEMTFNNIHKK
jgi:hypothetical protein